MTKLRQQIIASFSFVIFLIGLGFFVAGSSKKAAPADYLATQYLDKTAPTSNSAGEVGFFSFLKKIAGFDKEMSYLILFQNNLELRPTGGFVSSFATAKIDKGHPKDFAFYDTAVFDLNLSCPSQIEPPEPIRQYLWVKNWQFRDGNWSPDFPESAQKMIDLYHAQCGQGDFDGVIAITTEVLASLLKLYGPVYLADYDLTINQDNFLITLEKQVEIDYREQGIARQDRKNILRDLAHILIDKLITQNPLKSIRLLSLAKDHLEQKDILLYFKDENLQRDVISLGWAGKVKSANHDYFYVVDANVNAFKADYFVERNLDYQIDFNQNPPKARLIINYRHTAEEKSWLTRDYQSWLRVYVPEGAWFTDAQGLATEPQYGKEFGNTFIAALVKVPIGASHQVILEYDLPDRLADSPYTLLVQKQPGINNLNLEIEIKKTDGKLRSKQLIIRQDTLLTL